MITAHSWQGMTTTCKRASPYACMGGFLGGDGQGIYGIFGSVYCGMTLKARKYENSMYKMTFSNRSFVS